MVKMMEDVELKEKTVRDEKIDRDEKTDKDEKKSVRKRKYKLLLFLVCSVFLFWQAIDLIKQFTQVS